MKCNFIIKLLFVLCISVLLMINLSTFTYASNPNFSIDKYNEANAPDQTGLSGWAEKVAGVSVAVVRNVGYGTAVVILVVIAIKYMTSAPGERADIKKHAVPYVIGAVVLFASSAILGQLTEFAAKVF